MGEQADRGYGDVRKRTGEWSGMVSNVQEFARNVSF